MSNKDYYKILGVSENASDSEIKQAFHNLAFKHHPDRPGGDEKQFKEINEAYQTLSNKESKAQYDNMRKFGSSNYAGGFNNQGFYNNFNYEDLNNMSGGFGFNDIFESFFNQSYNQNQQRENKSNEDIELLIKISLKESFLGTKKPIRFNRAIICDKCSGLGYEKHIKIKTCSDCKGNGYIEKVRTIPMLGKIAQKVVCSTCEGKGKIPEEYCHKCHGEGWVNFEENKNIEIPMGIRNGDVLEIKNLGNQKNSKYMSGSLYVKVSVLLDDKFERQGDDLITNLNIKFTKATLGGKEEIKNINDQILILDITRGIESNTILKIKGKGFKRINHSGFGDLLIKIFIPTPKHLNKETEELVKKLDKNL